MQGAKRTSNSWWIDWTAWAGEEAGPMVEPPKMGSRKYKVLGEGRGENALDSLPRVSRAAGRVRDLELRGDGNRRVGARGVGAIWVIE